ncbi:cellulose synthase/poly-beta-1,6-N-acetylglucosamine synthase-like glycosyltransferase [Neorhizobium huautlense]|uniref:Cellulose synthase/poly-beta-1,6-N-acetylglucosamine synthase-like glycosyltransferase n=1 Tax=Neorhizobium huautlense TaxID=67774 RepID=A0ABT9PTS5_9HYPH|nr:glycosyltransferase [Neorhizobium huautlense]MDP9837870.1 cellulose synthase/poly-beta-1,6-N-acetylglucosamine synthase-like glycosyltransferase [Neorhizobium huautlense]
MLAGSEIHEDAYFAAMARFLRLPFIPDIDPAGITDTDGLDVQLLRPNQIRLAHAKKAPQVAIVPEAIRLAELAALIDRLPALRQGLVITTPSQIRSAVWAAGAKRRARAAVTDLFEKRTVSSARIVLSGAQGFAAGSSAATITAALLIAPQITLTTLHLTLSCLYLGSLLLRLAALAHDKHHPHAPHETVDIDDGNLPTYTILIALYREADVAGQLVRSLERIDWPHSLLDIKLVCEGDDQETIAALEALSLKPHFEIVRVPPCAPRTKPKALTYALCAARGEFLAVYDAEDRPHPLQLREALQRFRAGPQRLACLQAPLVISNARNSIFSALFALEYSALFRGLLPMIADYRLPLPLGGTSNHFRTSVLQQVGGWDPFNVTEDADLGLRLYRHGYHAATLRRQTLEDAPTSLNVWLGQRTRWYKGWMQTWLVTVRHPATHIRDMGLRGAFVFHLMIGGMLISALLHPLLFVLLGWGIYICLTEPFPARALLDQPLIAIDAVNILGSYILFVRLGLRSMTEHERQRVGRRWMAIPVYWMMTSLAAWSAANELRTKPFFWNKTPHRPVDAASGEQNRADTPHFSACNSVQGSWSLTFY